MSTILTAQANTESPTVDLEQVPPRGRRPHGHLAGPNSPRDGIARPATLFAVTSFAAR